MTNDHPMTVEDCHPMIISHRIIIFSCHLMTIEDGHLMTKPDAMVINNQPQGYTDSKGREIRNKQTNVFY